MEEFWILILVLFFFSTNSLDKAESVKVKLEETPLKTFDEIFGEGWWDKDEIEDLKMPPTNFGQNVHHQIDRQNTQIGQIKPNSTDQNPPLTESDHSGQIGPNSTDQNPPLTDSDHSDYAKNGEEQNEIHKEITSNETIPEDERKRIIIDKFHAIKVELKQKGKFPRKEKTQIEDKIAKDLKVNRTKIYKWKKEFGISQKVVNEKNERKNLVDKFDQKKAELKSAGFKNSYHHEIDETVAKELGITGRTIYNWKRELRELGQTKPKHKYAHSKQKELMKLYYEIKDQNPKISDEEIVKMLKISRETLRRWKKQFKREQLQPHSVVGHSVEENAGQNVQKIENINSKSS